MSFKLPTTGIVFWPVGNGDSTTICIDESTVMQVDLNHLEKSEESDDPAYPIIDHLVNLLPKPDKKPFLSLFTLTHPDNDHCRGFAELLKKVSINEIWFTPRIFREYKKDLSDDAKAFKEEAMRRVRAVIKNGASVPNGDRIRIVGYDDLLEEDEFKGFPKELLTIPGNEVTFVNGASLSSKFRAFIHSPFRDDSAGERNETSLGMQITVKSNAAKGHVIVLGDLSYPTIKKIFEISQADDLAWNIFLAPHHCSKKVMYWKDEGDKEETFKKDIMDAIEKQKKSGGYVIASAYSDFTDGEGDNPPHSKARKQYEKIVDAGHFLCTHERPNKKEPEPIKFELTEKGLSLSATSKTEDASKSVIATAVASARGGATPPQQQVGFGRR